MTELSLTVSRTIDAPAETLFNAWLDPAMLVKFMLPGAGMSVPRASSDPVEGGRFDIVMQGRNGEIPHHGIYKKITHHSQLIFTWQSSVSVDDSTVTLDFKPVQGGTQLNLHHVKFASEETRDNHQGGWSAILAALEAAT
ncbi:MAG: SRPBCC domain-containing protein [Marinosulfonomonas sp.]|nr:SRPBCC domain-containing protein [Marinosulfonomonas sp.]